MGCDIHAYVEGRTRGIILWDSIAKLSFPRHYFLFGLMAGVRGETTPIVAPRGLPSDCGWLVESDYYLEIVETYEQFSKLPIARILRSEAQSKGLITYEGSRELVVSPDWHTPSWLTLDELRKVQTAHIEFQRQEYGDVRYHTILNGIIALMAELQAQTYEETRLVFWFDN